LFTFQCTRCRNKPAIVTRGRKVFLCADCATGSLWYDMVGSLMDPDAAPSTPPADPSDRVESSPSAVDEPVPAVDGPTDPWEALA
jgi:hypothetical protein